MKAMDISLQLGNQEKQCILNQNKTLKNLKILWKTWTINIQLFGRQPFLNLPFGIYSNFIPSFSSSITYFNPSNLANKAILLTGHLFRSITSCMISKQNLIHREDISFHSINYVISLVKDRTYTWKKQLWSTIQIRCLFVQNYILTC